MPIAVNIHLIIERLRKFYHLRDLMSRRFPYTLSLFQHDKECRYDSEIYANSTDPVFCLTKNRQLNNDVTTTR